MDFDITILDFGVVLMGFVMINVADVNSKMGNANSTFVIVNVLMEN